MALNKPKFETVEGGTFRERIAVTSSSRSLVLTGKVPENIVELQIDLNGRGFQSDSDLVRFESGTFRIPNQDVFPEGLKLQKGSNRIRLRSIGPTGGTSTPAIANIDVVDAREVDAIANIPTGLSVRRHEGSVEIEWSEVEGAKGYHVYASRKPGGQETGYVRINKNMIKDPHDHDERTNTFFDSSVSYEAGEADDDQLMITVEKADLSGNNRETVQEETVDLGIQTANQRINIDVEEVSEDVRYHFEHDRQATQEEGTINNEFFRDVPEDESLFYVVTSTQTNPATGGQIESPFSAEVQGKPLKIDNQITEPPRRERLDVSRDFMQKVHNFDDQISLAPGSVSRDVFIEPFASEAERMYFLADFIRRSQSFSTLLQLDNNEAYKESLRSVLGLGAGTNVQAVIDDSFDKLATNHNIQRQKARPAVGEVVFYTETKPQNDIIIPEGTSLATAGRAGQVTFQLTSRVVLQESEKDSYFNEERRRWEIQGTIEAQEPGRQGNVSAGEITRIVGTSTSAKVINLEPTRFGQDEESNQSLAERAMIAMAGVDAGTEQGYLSSALNLRNVVDASVVKAGDDRMHRDYDPIREEHIGGKVDVWIQGLDREATTDKFALSLTTETRDRFALDSAPSKLVFKAQNDVLSEQNPIVEMLGNTTEEKNQGFEFKNLTTGDVFDLTGVKVLDHNRIQLNTNLTQPNVSPNDVVSGSYRYLESNIYEPQHQPVRDIQNIESLDSGEVLNQADQFQLLRTDDPLLQGRSVESDDRIRIDNLSEVSLFQVNEESHVLAGGVLEDLDKLGVVETSIRVFNDDRKTEYDGPSASTPDFFIREGSQTEPVKILRNDTGDIGDGEKVSVDYKHQENFEVRYTFNKLIQETQSHLNEERHITADVLAKQSLTHEVKMDLTIVLQPSVKKTQVDRAIRSKLGQLLNTQTNGTDVRQSDIIQVIEQVDGVSHVIMPPSTLTHDDGNLLLRRAVEEGSIHISSGNNTDVYLMKDRFDFHTTHGGGPDHRHRGIFQDDRSIEIVDSITELEDEAPRGMIVGQSGKIFQGYSDDTTLKNEGIDSSRLEAERKQRTGDRLVVSLPAGESPASYDWNVSYITDGNEESRSSVRMDDVSHSQIGSFNLLYDRRS